jgi:PTS system nitrogen regulatory IIA component
MHLTQYISEDRLFLQLDIPDKQTLLKKLTASICSESFIYRNPDYTPEVILERILEREQQRTTVVGEGVAFPHARLPGFSGIGVALATLKQPIDFDQGESPPVNIVCLVLTPRQTPTSSLKIMSGLCRGLAKSDYREKLCATQDPEQAIDMLAACDVEIDLPICGRDIMLPPNLTFQVDTPTSVIARRFFEKHVDAAPVIDHAGHIVGEVTTNRMFRFGVPPFFHQLKSVSFIAHYDPFEKYFAQEEKLTASDIMIDNVAIHSPDSTLLEIVFDLAVRRYPLVYIVDNNRKLIGIINRAAVLENIINF